MIKNVFPLKKLIVFLILTTILLSLMRIHVLRTLEVERKVIPELPTCNPNMTASTSVLMRSAPNHENPRGIEWPEWMLEFCPEVIEHFTLFPYFNDFKSGFPLMTTTFAAHSACSIKLANKLAVSINSNVFIHAGSHLGALLHAGPIPWDDDVDMFLNHDDVKDFLNLCDESKNFLPGHNVSLFCYRGYNAIKLSILTPQSHRTRNKWYSPFVDIFHFKIDDGMVKEVHPDGSWKKSDPINFPVDEYFPIKKFYFAGLLVDGPQEIVSTKRYKREICKIAHYAHRLELEADKVFDTATGKRIPKSEYIVDCCYMATKFPFVYNINNITLVHNGNNTLYLQDVDS